MEIKQLTERTAASEKVYSGVVFDVYSDSIILPNGHEARREYLSASGAVAVVALTEDGRVIMERQYRYAQGRVVYEIPAGKLEPGEEPLLAAMRELKEETGITAAEYVPLGIYMPSPAILREDIYIFLARGLSRGAARPDEDEFLEVESAPMEELVERIMAGEIRDGKTVFALLKARLYLEGERC